MYTFDEISNKINWKVINFLIDKLTKFEDAGHHVVVSARTRNVQSGLITSIWDSVNKFNAVDIKRKYKFQGIYYEFRINTTDVPENFVADLMDKTKTKFGLIFDIDMIDRYSCMFTIDDSFMAPFRRDYLNENNKSKR